MLPTLAHEQVMNMKNMLDHEVDHPQLHDHLVNAFGPNYNKAEIKKTVDRLAGGAFDIGSTNAPNTGEYAGVAAKTSSNARTARVGITEAFHKLTPEAQAGALLHEASHAIALTKDYFGPDAHNHIDSLKSENGKTEGTKSGYAHTDLDHLKQHASDVMHKNADSYRVFGHTATHGLAKPLPPIEVKPQHPCHSKSDGKDCSLQ
ncbi:hypothetical protein CPB84DRAFT_1867075 [Gymnopilus junonius]|uniref:Uncharacterized protein n=1 Tax=Gymnopilus junonius TaxID=109634 RepID=A0A9P5NDW4_GYMJU|nr:hypothetical protein CPB84DRAFT_1867075 [Gymnopilus junonius]